MATKKLEVYAGFLFLIILVLEIVSADFAQPCNIVERTSCSDDIVMGLSSETNAHAELFDQGNYNYVLCCDFEGAHSCIGKNKLLGLSSETNAHAEIPEEENYLENVCYGELECRSIQGNCDAEEFGVISLSDSTNAHLGKFEDYSKKICCKRLSQTAYWADTNGDIINTINATVGSSKVLTILLNSGLAEGTDVNFEIYEWDPIVPDLIRTINGVVNDEEDANASWTITQEDLDATGEEDFDDFYFIVNGEESFNRLSVNVVATPNCGTIDFCMNYKTKSECENDFCGVAGESVETNNPNVTCGETEYDEIIECNKTLNCECSWNDVNGACGPSYETILTNCSDESSAPEDPFSIGKCSYEENSTDDCDDGFLTYSWKGDWIWDIGNSFTSNPDEDDYRQDPIGGSWRYDPKDELGLRVSEKCADGEGSQACPAQIQLPFFGVYGVIGAVLLILLIYVLLFLKKKKSSRKKHK